MNRITDTHDAAALTIIRQGLDGEISPREVEKRFKRAELLVWIERLKAVGDIGTKLPKWMLK